jgi:hypothetical protein
LASWQPVSPRDQQPLAIIAEEVGKLETHWTPSSRQRPAPVTFPIV